MLARIPNEQDTILIPDTSQKIPHLPGRTERRFVEEIDVPFGTISGGRTIAGKKALQRVGWNSSLTELVGGTRSRREAFDGIPGYLRASVNDGECGRLSTAGGSLQSQNLIAGEQYFFNDTTLRSIQVRVRLRDMDDLLDGSNRPAPILPIDHARHHFLFRANHLLGRELTGAGMNPPRSNLEFTWL